MRDDDVASGGPDRPSDFTTRVAAVVASIATGECASYAEVAAEAGRPGAARAVGRVLRDVDGLPWWRVVRSDGTLAMGERQAALLRAEGVRVESGRIRP